MRVLVLLLAMLWTLPLQASEIVGSLSQNRVALTANFTGSQILIFGAIRHGPDDFATGEDLSDYDVAIAVEGPREAVTIWRRDRVLGIWMNVEQVTLAAVPSFYAVATSDRVSEILSPETDAALDLTPAHAIRPDHALSVVDEITPFTDALLRIRARNDQFMTLERWVHLDRDILFRATVDLPANLIEGAYITRMYLLRNGEVVHQYRTAIFVQKDGLERFLYQLAHDQPLLYGLLAIALALIAGWGAQAAFTLLRQR